MDTSSYKELWGEVKKYITLQVDYAKLTAVEKLTILVSRMAFVGVALALSICAFFFLSEALVAWFETVLNCRWLANLIVCGVVIVVILIITCFKKPLIIDPVSRFVTKLFLTPPKK